MIKGIQTMAQPSRWKLGKLLCIFYIDDDDGVTDEAEVNICMIERNARNGVTY